MSRLFAIVIAANLEAAGHEVPGDWHVWLLRSSGWGGKTGIYVDATGRNVAYVDSSSRNLVVDLRRGMPALYCEKLPLSELQVRKFAFRIASIPGDVLDNGGLLINGSCMDEPRNGVTLKMDGREFHFGYSQLKHCRDGQKVPEWLTGLVDALWTRYREIKECNVPPLGAGSVP